MGELAKFCSDAAAFIGMAIDIALTYQKKQKFNLMYLKKHPYFEARFLLPPSIKPEVHIPIEIVSNKLPEVHVPMDQYPPPSPPDNAETPDMPIARNLTISYSFTDELNQASSPPDSHFSDMWMWGKALLDNHSGTVTWMNNLVDSPRSPHWTEFIALGFFETVKAILTAVNVTANNREIVNYFKAKLPLHIFMYEHHFFKLAKSAIMSQKARQGFFINYILSSAASTKEDSFESYTDLENEIVFSDPDIDLTIAEDAKPIIEARLRTPVVQMSFRRVFQAFDEELIQEDFINIAQKYLQKTRSLPIRTFGATGMSLPNHHILVDLFRETGRDFLRIDAILVVFLHELAHSLLRRKAKTFKEYLGISTPSQSGHTSPQHSSPQQFRFGSLDDQHFFNAFQMLWPFEYKKTNREAGEMLEQELFGGKVKYITLKLHRFMSASESWNLSPEAFREAFKKIQHNYGC